MDYTEIIRRWASDDSRSGEIENPDGTGEVGIESGAGGSSIAVRFFIKLHDNQIECVRFHVFGCGFTIASCAAAAKLAEGLPVERAHRITAEAIDEKLGRLPMERRYCALLAARALQSAIQSACGKKGIAVSDTVSPPEEEMHARVDADHPVYRMLIESRAKGGLSEEDRHLVACLLSAASDEPRPIAEALGISDDDLSFVMSTFFPDINISSLPVNRDVAESYLKPNEEITELILSYVPQNIDASEKRIAEILSRILSARTALKGHLWVSMGFFKRPELTAAIRRHLPDLADANCKGMRWKRFLFKALCDKSGANLCKAPTCGECSDYALCFAPLD